MASALYPMGMEHVKNQLLHKVSPIAVIWLLGRQEVPAGQYMTFNVISKYFIFQDNQKKLKSFEKLPIYSLSGFSWTR